MAWKLGYHANCWGPLGGDAVGVTSIKDLAYRTFGDMGRAVREIGEAGYEGVEMFDGNLADCADDGDALRSILDGAGMRLVAAYAGANFIFPDVLPDEMARVERAATLAAEMGAEHLVVGGGAKRHGGPREGDYDRLCEGLDAVVDLAEACGLRAHYHPHLTTLAEGPEEVARVLNGCRIDFCPDTAHLAAAGGDPAAMIREHANRISYVHLKGWRREPFAFTPLDEGDLDIGGVVGALEEIGYDGWVLTELDAWPDPAEGARRSRAFLDRARAAPA